MSNYPQQPYNPQQQYQQQYQQPYQQTYQPQYQQPVYQQPYDPTKEIMSIGSYIGMFLLSAFPLINIICWIVWLCSPNTNKNKKNFIWASIILWAISMVLTGIVIAIFAITGLALFDEFIGF